jgi:hypothetical protein
VQQLLSPLLYGGTWGEAVQFGLGQNPDSATVSQANYIAPSGAFGGGSGAPIVTSGTLVSVGASGISQTTLTTNLTATSLANSALRLGAAVTRTFQILSWFQLGE